MFLSIDWNSCVLLGLLPEEVVNVIVEGGAVPALVKHLQAPPIVEGDRSLKPFEHEVEKGSAFALGLLAVKVKFILLYLDTCFPIIISTVCMTSLYAFFQSKKRYWPRIFCP